MKPWPTAPHTKQDHGIHCDLDMDWGLSVWEWAQLRMNQVRSDRRDAELMLELVSFGPLQNRGSGKRGLPW
jgi:hypothetical protein